MKFLGTKIWSSNVAIDSVILVGVFTICCKLKLRNISSLKSDDTIGSLLKSPKSKKIRTEYGKLAQVGVECVGPVCIHFERAVNTANNHGRVTLVLHFNDYCLDGCHREIIIGILWLNKILYLWNMCRGIF